MRIKEDDLKIGMIVRDISPDCTTFPEFLEFIAKKDGLYLFRHVGGDSIYFEDAEGFIRFDKYPTIYAVLQQEERFFKK